LEEALGVRHFKSGATRDDDDGKPEPWGFTSALVEKVFSDYMQGHRKQADGVMRESDNWKKGIPLDVYWHALSRHVLDFRLLWEKFPEESRTPDILDALCAVRFNVDGLIHELKAREVQGMREKG
jgi:hypothetical protein